MMNSSDQLGTPKPCHRILVSMVADVPRCNGRMTARISNFCLPWMRPGPQIIQVQNVGTSKNLLRMDAFAIVFFGESHGSSRHHLHRDVVVSPVMDQSPACHSNSNLGVWFSISEVASQKNYVWQKQKPRS